MSLAAFKAPEVFTLSPTATVQEAAKKMADHHVGSIVVLEGDKLVGIFTERDLLNRVISKGLDPQAVALSGVMSKNVRTVSVEDSVEGCYQKMQDTKCRHIPLVEGDKVVGIVTMRNILEFLTEQMKTENIHLKNYIQG
jgi:CBS domain-containing protein